MVLLSAQGLCKAYGDRTLFSDVSFDVRDGERIGLVGVNGAGKTTLLNIFTGETPADAGRARVFGGASLGHMRQHVPGDLTRTLYDEAMEVFSPLQAIERELAAVARAIDEGRGDVKALVARQDRLGEAYASKGGYTYKSRLRSTLLGVGFFEEEFGMPLGALSGGQRSKVQLSRLLLCGARVLLLDEPTNHLDGDSVEWLENYLQQFRGAFVVVSHDRYFLDRVTNRTLELENGRLASYAGGYTQYFMKKQRETEVRRRHREQKLREIRRIEGIVAQQKQWNRERNLRAARSKQKVADRLKMTLDAPVKKAPGIGRYLFGAREGCGEDALVIRGLKKGFGGKPLFSDVSLHIRKGERVFLLGPNGCGKTTLLKALVHAMDETRFREYAPDAGRAARGPGVRFGYYEQTLESLDPGRTVLDEVWNAHSHLSQTQARNALAAFLFRGDDVFKTVGVLSGGERARVALVKLMLSPTNLLLLDEPTNHLDIASREALEDALCAYGGTILAVSHDRYLVNKLAHRIVWFDGRGGIAGYAGDYDSYVKAREEAKAEDGAQDGAAPQEKPAGGGNGRKKETAALIRSLKARMRRAEAEIERAEARVCELDAKLAGGQTDFERVLRITNEMETERARLEDLYAAWEEAGLRLDALSGAGG
ncbi:MAG: ABC-F family ATP-binding cassette domain-containing protein [Clostridiales bacterium]|nr:ABC-F family ATP-binding cassette domain-containing protein [Clostridiales bacterium]